MSRHKHGFNYYFSWTILGLAAGFVILMVMGQIKLTIPGNLYDTTKDSAGTSNGLYNGYAQAVARAAPAVVSIRTQRKVTVSTATHGERLLERFFGLNSPHGPKTKTKASYGSGVILDPEGYILTNYHVIANAVSIQVTLNDGRSSVAEHIGKDPDTDLAVLKIDLENLPVAKTADINQVRIGDVVLAIGYPFKIGQTVTQGIISATGRTRVSESTYENFLQTDAAINPGNSGGALINVAGEMVGINSLIYTKTGSFAGIGFAIPVDIAQNVLDQIAANGYVVRGWLGVEGQDLTQQIMEKIGLQNVHGILITGIDIGGPGYKAGIEPGDIISHINNQPIMNTMDIMNIIAAGKPGDIIELRGVRQRSSFSVKAKLEQRPLMSR